MAVAATTRRLEEHPPPAPISVGMMGMYIFLASEVMFFGTLFAVYFYLHGSHLTWPPPMPKNPVPFTGLTLVNTFILFSSGVTAHIGLEDLRHPDRHPIGAALLGVVFMTGTAYATYAAFGEEPFGALLGVIALGAQLVALLTMLGFPVFSRPRNEYDRRGFTVLLVMTIILGFLFELGQLYEFTHAGFGLTASQFTSAFFTMTGFHGGHVLGGLIILLLLLGRTLRGHFAPAHHVGVAAGTLYWHFVDLVWAFLYGVLYIGIAYRL
jgi:heme/copper-type cytochrome/quinol oxidase subunit 3